MRLKSSLSVWRSPKPRTPATRPPNDPEGVVVRRRPPVVAAPGLGLVGVVEVEDLPFVVGPHQDVLGPPVAAGAERLAVPAVDVGVVLVQPAPAVPGREGVERLLPLLAGQPGEVPDHTADHGE